MYKKQYSFLFCFLFLISFAFAQQSDQTIDEASKKKSENVFDLGRIDSVDVTAEATQIPTAATLDESEYRQRNLNILTDALNLVPGVSVQRIGARNSCLCSL